MSDIPVRKRQPVFNPPPSFESTLPPNTEVHDLSAEVMASEAEQRMIKFVTDQIDRMKSYIQLGSGHDPTFYEINQALCGYQDVHFALLAMHNTARIEHIKAKEAYENWFAEKYLIVREQVNPRSLSAQKWASQKELEYEVRTTYADEFKRLNWAVIEAEHQLNFLRRLLDSWGSYQFVLTQLSKNTIAEVAGIGVGDTLNKEMERFNNSTN